jgi:hypothetical protein
MFANSKASYGDRIMSLMKRGALTCLLFFVLSLIASTGPNALKIAKAFGALIIVAILLTSPVNTVLTDVDALIKNDWVGTSEHATANTGTASSTDNTVGKQITGIKGGGVSALPLPGSPESNAISGIVKKILSGIGINLP